MCGAIGGPGAAICAANIAIQAPRIEKNLNAAVNRRGCFVLRYNILVGSAVAPAHPNAVSFGNVASSNQFCKP
jgi:hypothetical protein